MAHTARKESEKKEYFDPPDVLEQKVETLAQWVKESSHFITFTGAGVSTAAGIPDFRSGMNTCLPTGPGVWELRAHSTGRSAKHAVTDTIKAIPTATHMTFVKLQQDGVLKCCVSQNTDGLHRRSGLPKIALCELHGNTNLEVCDKCGREYLRDFRVRRPQGVHQHLTGRTCDDPQCRGRLRDTIINFGESLPQDELDKACEEAEVADLCLAMGSSLTVTPAADIPERVALRRKRLVIVNLQQTPLDSLASLRINCKCDDVARMLMKKLDKEIPEFKLKRQMILKMEAGKEGREALVVGGRDTDGLPFSFFKEVVASFDGGTGQTLQEEPFIFPIPWEKANVPGEMKVKVVVHFIGHYREPPLERAITITRGQSFQQILKLEYNPFTLTWAVNPPDVDKLAVDLAAVSV